MKLIIQIPCYNEEKTLPITLRNLPQKITGIDEIDVLVIDDGSTDKTVEVAKKCGVKSFAIMPRNSGLGKAFSAGLNRALELNADIIVNTDTDNQYSAVDIEKLVAPILNKQADIVVGERPLLKIKEWSLIKRYLQKFGTFVVGTLSGVKITDATSGFRAYSKEAAMRLNLFEKFSYTLESTMQTKAKNLILKSVPIHINNNTRKSKLMKNILHFMIKQGSVILRSFLIYRPFMFFTLLSGIFCISGLAVLFCCSETLVSQILAMFLLFAGVLTFIIALFSQLMVFNRKLLENISYEQKQQIIKQNIEK